MSRDVSNVDAQGHNARGASAGASDGSGRLEDGLIEGDQWRGLASAKVQDPGGQAWDRGLQAKSVQGSVGGQHLGDVGRLRQGTADAVLRGSEGS